jgi:hypothetical protein
MQIQMDMLSGKEPSGLIKARPYIIRETNPEVGSYDKSANMVEGGTLDEITKQSYMGIPKTIYEGTREFLTSKPFGDPAEAETLMGKVGKAAANTAFKVAGAPVQLATDVIGAAMSPTISGVNTQESRRAGDIYKSSQEEMNVKKTAKNIASVREDMLRNASKK